MRASNQMAHGCSSTSKHMTRLRSTCRRTRWLPSCMASVCCHACHQQCRHLAVQVSAHSASQQLMPNQWQKPQVSHTSANLISTIRSTPSTKFGRSHFRHAPLICSAQAFVAQWIEHLTSDQRVGGSSPSERTTKSRRGVYAVSQQADVKITSACGVAQVIRMRVREALAR